MSSSTIARLGRRLVALLTLSCGALAQSAMLACPMALTAPAAGVASQHDVHAQHEAHAQHAQGAADAAVSSPGSVVQDVTSPHPEAGCSMPTGCGAAGITAPRLSTARMGAFAAEAARPFGALDYRTVFPPHDPPPPRLRV